MPERSTGLYPDEHGVMLVTFEQGTKGVPVESLIPPKDRGDAFGDFALADYLSLAELVLARQEDFAEAGMQAKAEANQNGKPVGLKLPLDLDYLKLRLPNGDMDPVRTAEIFEVVQAYWTAAQDSLALEPGFVAAAVHRGMTPPEVIEFIQEHSQIDPETGKVRLVFPDVPMEAEFLSHLFGPSRSASEVTRETLDLLARWFSSVPPGHATFELPQRKTDDLMFLGLLDASGSFNKTAVADAGDFIWDRLEQPDFAALWRYLHRADYPMSELDADAAHYNLQIAELADADTDALGFVQAILAQAKDGRAVPTERLCRAARVVWELDRATDRDRAEMEAALRRQPLELDRWLTFDNAVLFTRACQKMIADQRPMADLMAHMESALSKAGTADTIRQHQAFYRQPDYPDRLRELGVIDDKNRWSETGFVRQQLMMEEARRNGVPPSLEWLRWALHRRYRADKPAPFAWALMDDRLPKHVLARARVLASMALSGGMTAPEVAIGETITPEQFRLLRSFGAWLSVDNASDQAALFPDLSWLAELAKRPEPGPDHWFTVCDFVFGKLNEPPSPDRLQAHLRALGVTMPTLTADSQGTDPKAPLALGRKPGRNDPCPCGSGKKYKKCCGR